MTRRKRLLAQIAQLESLMESQHQRYDEATRCLSQTQASIAVTKMSAGVLKLPLTQAEVTELANALQNSIAGVAEAFAGLSELRKELDGIKNEFIMLPGSA